MDTAQGEDIRQHDWTGRPERHGEVWFARIAGDESRRALPQIGDRVLIQGNRKHGTGAEFIARITAVRERRARSTLVLTEGPPWQTETPEGMRARNSLAEMTELRTAEIRNGLGLCILCAEPKQACACIRQEQERLERDAAEQAKRRLAEEVAEHNRAVEKRRKAITTEAVAQALEDAHGDMLEAMRRLGVVKRVTELRSWGSRSRFGEPETGRQWLSSWIRRRAPELASRAEALRTKSEVRRACDQQTTRPRQS